VVAAFKESVRARLPRPLWVLARRGWSYLRRLRHWLLVLAEVRGDGPAEALKLWLSALAAPSTALPRLDDWRNPVLLFDTRVRVAGDRFLCLRAADDLWHVLPSGQGAVRRAIEQHLPPGGVFVDAGANVGAFTVFGARRVGSGGSVIAIEMMPDTTGRLRRHLALNGLEAVRVVEAALSDAAGQEVVARMPAGLAGQASIVQTELGLGGLELRVRTTTLDEVLEGVERIDVMKMDLEGAEALALAGGRNALSKTRCLIFESWASGEAGQGAAVIAEEAGFRLARLDGNNVIGFR